MQNTVSLTLGTAVTSPAGTFVTAYPTGLVQADFTSPYDSATGVMVVNDNDVWTEAADKVDISYGASTITVTNKTGATLPAGSRIVMGYGRAGTAITVTEGPAITSLTDSTTGTASDTLAATVGIVTVPIHLNLVSMTTAAADLITNYTPGYAFELLSAEFVTTKLGTGASASQVLNLEIGTTNVTGGVLTLLLADTDTLGKKTAATAITAANVGTAASTISLEVAASGTVFTAGEGILLLKLRNLDTVNAVASLAAKVNALLTSLRASNVLDE